MLRVKSEEYQDLPKVNGKMHGAAKRRDFRIIKNEYPILFLHSPYHLGRFNIHTNQFIYYYIETEINPNLEVFWNNLAANNNIYETQFTQNTYNEFLKMFVTSEREEGGISQS